MKIEIRNSVVEILRQEIEGFTLHDLDTPLDNLNVDSFGLVSLRARIEQCVGVEIADEAWLSAISPSDILKMVSTQVALGSQPTVSEAHSRSFRLNMPQMAMGGLSESWLFKELGDMHWHSISEGLGAPSADLRDGAGNRLYATFTRISISVNPLSSYKENGDLHFRRSSFSRMGAGLFFSEIDILPGTGRATLMSAFSARGEAGSNTSLQKGQPLIPPGCAIPQVSSYPAFAEEYRARRNVALSEPLFECEYEIVPQHDINGVDLLYFAAYPIISDICLSRYSDQQGLSTVHKDVFYFSNCEAGETLVFRLHNQIEDGDLLKCETSISRKSDGANMAFLTSTKQIVR